jgi:hypothetical protein
MRSLFPLAVLASLLTVSVAQAQETVVVDLTQINAELAADLGIETTALPPSVVLTADAAAEACGVDIGTLGDTCLATTATDDIFAALDRDDGEGEVPGDGEGGTPNANSAREFAPGQQDGPARDHAPGQQDGPARDHAPGQVKKNAGNRQ